MRVRQLLSLACYVAILAALIAPHPVEARKASHSHKVTHQSKKSHRRKKTVHRGAPVDSTASYADIVIDADTGRIIHATNADSLRHPASLTKMMTLYLTFQALEAERLQSSQPLTVSANAAEQSPSKLGLRPGQHIRVEDAIMGLVTESANDAAVVLAEAMGGSESGFGVMMTKQARALGMTHSRFDNPSGLPDPEQVTTARDMAVLGYALIHHFPQFYPIFSHDSFVYAGINHHNHNHLMERYEGMDGIKTGYIRASGFNLVASVKRGDLRLIGVVFGGRSAAARDNRMAQLLDEAFDDVKQDRAETRVPTIASLSGEAEGDASDSDDAKQYVKFPGRNGTTQKAAPTPTGNWGIQIGAYSDEDIGQKVLTQIVSTMPKLLGDADPVVMKTSTGGDEVMYRARLMGIEQKTAESACSWLVQHGQSCLTVKP
jgi:D-alanyl-D-alanine carboxypeptidase